MEGSHCCSTSTLQTSSFAYEDDSTFIMFSQASQSCTSDYSLDLEKSLQVSFYCQNIAGVPFHSTPLKRLREFLQLSDALTSNDSDTDTLIFTTPASQSTKEASEITSSQCCKKRCLANLSILEIKEAREMFSNKEWVEQEQLLLDSAFICHPAASDRGSSSCKTRTNESTMMIEGKRVCKETFIKVLGISYKRYRRTARLHQIGFSKATKKTPTRSKLSKSREAKAWMETYFHLVGDRMFKEHTSHSFSQ